MNARRLTARSVALAAGLLIGATSALAANYTPDTLLGSATLPNSNPANELAALEAAAGLAAGSLALDTSVTGTLPAQDDNGDWFINVAPDQPGYFLLKFGNSAAPDTHYFFQNAAEMNLLVWSNAQVDFATGGCTSGSCNIGKLSHYTLSTGPSSSSGGGPGSGTIPEPGSSTLALLGLGLLAAGLRARKPR